MGRKSKRRYKDIVDPNNTNSDGEEQITDIEWNRMKKEVENEIKYDDLVWEAIRVYHELEDECHWQLSKKPSIFEFIDDFMTFDLIEESVEDDDWVTVF